jgi:hypothetical protein
MYRPAPAVDAPYGIPLNERIPLLENPRILPHAVSTMLPALGATTVRAATGFAVGEVCPAASTRPDSNGAAAALAARPAADLIHPRRSMPAE